MATTATTAPTRSGAHQVTFSQRGRLVEGAAWVCAEEGASQVTVARVIAAAGVSRNTFYREFSDCEDCLAHAFLAAGTWAGERAGRAFARESGWRGSLRAAVTELLRFFDEQPQLASLCLAEPLVLGPAASEARERFTAQIEAVLLRGSRESADEASSLTARGLIGGAWWILHARRRDPDAGPLLELLNPLMAFLVGPYAGPEAAKDELAQPVPAPSALRATPQVRRPTKPPRMRMTYRTMQVIAAIGRNPGMSNREVLASAGMSDQGQASKLLQRLERAAVVVNRGAGQQRGQANAWYLTRQGRELNARLKLLSVASR